MVRWSVLAPTSTKYEFEERIGQYLRRAADEGIYATLKIWAGPDAPEWIYSAPYNVPMVATEDNKNPVGGDGSTKFPYYFSNEYRTVFFDMIDDLSDYIYSLPENVRERLLFIQSAEGSTGDGQCYKSTPLDPKYNITQTEWNQFRRETWSYYSERFPDIPILVNGDSNEQTENQWIIDNFDVFALKNGMFSHGYVVSESAPLLEDRKNWYKQAEQVGKPFISRGEMDAEMFTYGWSTRNIEQGLYWSGIYALHNMLDVWNIPHKALQEYPGAYAYTFFNKYAGFHKASIADGAFCALVDRLDANDTVRFPEATFGQNSKTNKDRYLRIADAFKEYGAKQQDNNAAVQGRMGNRKANGINDVSWDIISKNYYRYLEQVSPGDGDVGIWNIDESIYGRFARSFENSSGKTFMKFKLDSDFFANNSKPKNVKVTITWLDRGTGCWSLDYANKNGRVTAYTVTNENSGQWKTKNIELSGAMFDGRLDNSDLVLQYISGDNTIFHMIELERN